MTSSLTRHQHNLAAASRFVRFYYTTKVSGSNVQIDSVMIQTPPPPAQGISAFQNAAQLVNNGLFVFGNASSKSFTIQNFGVAANLVIDSVIVSGQHASDFSIGTFDSTITPNNGTGNLAVQFVAGANGSRFATIKIYSNDAERNPFNINLYGIGGTLATEPATQAAAVNISNIRPFAMNISFSRASGGAEKYIVIRKAGGPVNEIPVDGVTYKKGDYIGENQVAYIGTDTALLRPTYILANTTYSFAAFAFNGPDGYENYKTDAITRETVTTPAEQMGNYYSSINPKSNTFITNLATRLRAPHDTVFYSNYAPTLVNNFLTRDTSGGKKVVNCVYTGIAYLYEDPFLWQASSNSTGILTREHTFAQSWMPTRSLPNFPEIGGREILEYNDLHHLFPADQNNANGVRSNHPFGIVVNPNSISPTGFGKRGTDSRGITVYEPKDDQKGNLARALFYMLVRYDGERGNQWRLPTNQDINVLLQWHQQDPPDALEIARNEYIASIQKNRNPFIDHPEWVDRINFSTMAYIPDPSAGIVEVTAPAVNATIVAGTSAIISWTSTSNIDSVLIELKTSPSAAFKTIGKYVSTLNSIAYQFDESATSHAMVRISKVSDTLVNASSGVFRIVRSNIAITKPSENAVLPDYNNVVIKWTQTYVDTVDVTCYLQVGSSIDDSVVVTDLAAVDSVVVSLPVKPFGGNYLLIVKEKSSVKSAGYLATDSSTFSVVLPDALQEQALLNGQVSVYPNPTKGDVFVYVSSGIKATALTVTDLAGRIVLSKKNMDMLNELTISGLDKGVYFVHLITAKGQAIKKIIVE